MKPHPNRKKWNIIFLIYAELADAASIKNAQNDDYEVNVKADLSRLMETILKIEVADSYNVFTVENRVLIKNNVITRDRTYIRLLAFDFDKKKNHRALLKTSKNENFDQKSNDIQSVFEYIEQYYPAKKNLLITWDHGSAFGIFKKLLSDPTSALNSTFSPQSIVSPDATIEKSVLDNAESSLILDKAQISTQPQPQGSSIITFVRGNQIARPDFFFSEIVSEDNKQSKSKDFEILSNDNLAKAIKNGFKNKYVDTLLMFNCDMQNMHTCYSLRNCAKYFVAPEGPISAPGYDYLTIARLIRNTKGIVDGKEIASLAVNSFKQNYKHRHKALPCEQIAVFAVCLVSYTHKVIKPVQQFIITLQKMMSVESSLKGNLINVRRRICAFGLGKNMDYFLVDMNNYMNGLVESVDNVQIENLRKTLQNARDSVVICSVIGTTPYWDGTNATLNCKGVPTGLSIYFPPRLQDPTTVTPRNFILPNAPFSTRLLKTVKWMEFLSELYGK